VESIPKTQWESARAVGFSPLQVYRYVIFPQALRRVLPAMAGLFVSLIKDSSLLNVIGVAEYFYNTRNFISRSYAGLEGYVPLAQNFNLNFEDRLVGSRYSFNVIFNYGQEGFDLYRNNYFGQKRL
jgi:ABC-type arginine/histidine transport system permease subunit